MSAKLSSLYINPLQFSDKTGNIIVLEDYPLCVLKA